MDEVEAGGLDSLAQTVITLFNMFETTHDNRADHGNLLREATEARN